MLSRQLPTKPLPVLPVPIGYCERNRRFGLRIFMSYQTITVTPSFRTHALPRSFTRFLRLAKISPNVARNASFVLTALLRQLLTLLFHRVANRVANFVASDVASRDYHPVANPVAPSLLITLLTLLQSQC